MSAIEKAPRSNAKVALVCAVPLTFNVFMRDHISAISEKFQLSLVCKGVELDLKLDPGSGYEFEAIPIQRKIAPFRDLYALFKLIFLFRRAQFSLVQSITPKAGLLAMAAAFISRIPVRLHFFTGQVWATKSGLPRFILKSMDRVTAALSTHLLADSPSQRLFLIHEGVVKASKISVLMSGSICGVDSVRFSPDTQARNEVRNSFAIPKDDVLALFIGRLTSDKGIIDLALAFRGIAANQPNLRLMIVGPDEDGITQKLEELLADYRDRVHIVSYTDKPEKYMAAADIFCLPSYREGFGSVVIEAAAVGLPAIASKIYGLTDAVEEGVTGFLHEPRSIEQLMMLLERYAGDTDVRIQMGRNARARAIKQFSSEGLVQAQIKFYSDALKAAGKK